MWLAAELWHSVGVDFNMAVTHELDGILLTGVTNFTFGVDAIVTAPINLAYLQLGGADIMHVLFARHLGYKYLASFDQDFRTARDTIRDLFGITVLASPDELLQALKRGD